MARPIGGGVGIDGMTEEERAAQEAILAARKAAYQPGSTSGFPAWAWVAIGVGVVAVAGVAFYFMQR